jgi:lipid-A-disaccharide synthase
VDAPDFNLGLATTLRTAGVRTVQLVCPSIWAWRRERAPKIRAAVDEVLCVFPFEPEVLAKEGIAGRFVGHPLADMLPATPNRAAARNRLGLPEQGAPIVALLPGSRRDEIKHLAPRMIAAAAVIQQRIPEARFVLPAASGERRAELAVHLAQSRATIQMLDGRAHDALEAADSVLVASGTATLEAALFHCPMVIAYAMPALSYWMMKGKGYLPWIGLPNILCNEWVVPELIQDAATPRALADAAIKQLTDTAHAAAIGQRFAGLHAQLRQGFPTQCAQAIESHLNAA